VFIAIPGPGIAENSDVHEYLYSNYQLLPQRQIGFHYHGERQNQKQQYAFYGIFVASTWQQPHS